MGSQGTNNTCSSSSNSRTSIDISSSSSSGSESLHSRSSFPTRSEELPWSLDKRGTDEAGSSSMKSKTRFSLDQLAQDLEIDIDGLEPERMESVPVHPNQPEYAKTRSSAHRSQYSNSSPADRKTPSKPSHTTRSMSGGCNSNSSRSSTIPMENSSNSLKTADRNAAPAVALHRSSDRPTTESVTLAIRSQSPPRCCSCHVHREQRGRRHGASRMTATYESESDRPRSRPARSSRHRHSSRVDDYYSDSSESSSSDSESESDYSSSEDESTGSYSSSSSDEDTKTRSGDSYRRKERPPKYGKSNSHRRSKKQFCFQNVFVVK